MSFQGNSTGLATQHPAMAPAGTFTASIQMAEARLARLRGLREQTEDLDSRITGSPRHPPSSGKAGPSAVPSGVINAMDMVLNEIGEELSTL